MTSSFNPSRLSLARRRRGLTKVALAHQVLVSSRIMTAYESGEKEPSEQTLVKIASILQFPVEFFEGPDLDEPPVGSSSFRAFSRLTARLRDQSLAEGALALALSDWIDARFKIPKPDVPRYQGIEPETASIGVRREWGLGERPIQNVIHLLESRGVRVYSLVEDTVEMDAFSFWRGDLPYIFLNTFKSAERSRMDAAHELGHLILHWKGVARGRDAEREAQEFASAFLMPRGSILAEAPRGARLTQIIQAKQRWKVAVASLTYRMHTVGLLTDWQYRTLFMEIGRKGYRTNEPNGSNSETSQVLAKIFKALREDGITMNQVARELRIMPDELSKIIFGLVLAPLTGLGRPGGNDSKGQPNFHVV